MRYDSDYVKEKSIANHHIIMFKSKIISSLESFVLKKTYYLSYILEGWFFGGGGGGLNITY